MCGEFKMLTEQEIYQEIQKHRQEDTPFLSADEKDLLLRAYHPDYSLNGKTQLSSGPNKGEWLPRELVELIEESAEYPRDVTLTETQILVIGGGGAGISAALEAASRNVQVMLVTQGTLGASNTALAQGGIAAALETGDSPELHATDTISSGKTNNPQLVRVLTQEAAAQVSWLEGLGISFDRNSDGSYALSTVGGHSRARLITHKGLVGPRLIKVLANALKNSSCDVRPDCRLADLWLDENGECQGAILYEDRRERYFKVKARAVILATGGIGGLNPYGYPTTNHQGSRGEGLAAAYRAGAKLVDMVSMQFHPTLFVWPASISGRLASELFRTYGAGLYNALGQKFVNPLESRDVVTSSILREFAEGRGVSLSQGIKGVWLDTPAIPREKFMLYYKAIFSACMLQGLDPTSHPLLVAPALHYQNGGVKIDEQGRTTVRHLWAAGEVTGGIHGRNRLGGNALTDIFVFGRRAGSNVVDAIKK